MQIRKKFNPLRWQKKTVIIVAIAFYAVFLPVYVCFGLQPTIAADSDARLSIQSIALTSGVKFVEPSGVSLDTPDSSIGAYLPNDDKVFLFAHSTGAFKNLKKINLEDEILYNSETYIVAKIETLPVEKISMDKLLSSPKERTLILMTCAGQEKDGKFDSRLIVTAVLK